MRTNQQKLQQIIENDYGVRSGVYTAIDSNIRMELDSRGEYRPRFQGNETEETYEKLLAVDMMSSESPNEDELGRELFAGVKEIAHDPVLGYHSDLYVGYVKDGDFRERGSSGGFTSWILAELLKQKKIDGVIHAYALDPKKNSGKLFKYVVSRSIREVQAGAKSRYYPMELSEVLAVVKSEPGRYAVVGIPEFITELRLLMRVDPVFKERIAYTLGLICGHQKSAKYAEALAWQHGIKPGNLLSIDFRVKQPESTASNYLHTFAGVIDGKKVSFVKSHDELFSGSWPAGFFKSKFSDFTDNAFNEVADVTLGDAWLPEYNADGMGNNVVIVRNPEVAALIKDGIKAGVLSVDEVSPDVIKNSQAGLIHHVRDELPYRLAKQIRLGKWVPIKRVTPSSKLKRMRKRVQDIRYQMATSSHLVYEAAVKRGEWSYFQDHMTKLLDQYAQLYKEIGRQRVPLKQKLRQKLRPRTRIMRVLRWVKHTTRVRTRIRSIVKRLVKARDSRRYRQADGAILTLTGYYNYGNIIQRYALQEFLKQNGLSFVSYWHEQLNAPNTHPERLRYTKEFVDRWIVRKSFDPKDSFPAYIVGSDQVWRNWGYSNEKNDLGYYFLNFSGSKKTKRVAYAASIGQSSISDAGVSEDFVEYAKPLVRNFDGIAMREKSGVEAVRKTWGVKPVQVLDPTMLLGPDDYDHLIEESGHPLAPVDPIFTYVLIGSDEKTKILNKIIGTTNLMASGLYLENPDVLPPIEQWLKSFRDAELVVTDSFHGMVFSIINNTPFVVLESSAGGVARITSLLSQLGLEDRLVVADGADMYDFAKHKPIDWRRVNKKVAALREKSGNWLLNMLDASND